MSGRARRVLISSLAAAAALGITSASAGAATVTLGDPLTQFMDGGFLGNNGSTETVANTTIQEPGGHATSPVNGTIVSWRVLSLGTGEYALRVLRPAGGGSYTGAGRSPGNVSVAGDNTFSASLPIQAGDLIGLDLPDNQGVQGRSLGVPDGVWSGWVPQLPEGTSLAPIDTNTHAQLAIQATVEYSETPTGGGGGGGAGAGGPGVTSKKCKKKKKHKRSAQSAKKKCKKKR
jgi:hypothetical protein